MGNRLRGAVALLVLLAACKGQPPAASTADSLTPEAKAYTRYLKLSEIELKATESFSGQTITEIEGKITNAGDRTVDYAAVACIFYDRMNQMILREKVSIVKRPLKPGESRTFRLPFDTVPQSWNTRLPQVVIAQIRLS